MPYAFIPNAVFVTYRGVTIYHLYRNDSFDGGTREFWFTTEEHGCENDENAFDIRDIEGYDGQKTAAANIVLMIDAGHFGLLDAPDPHGKHFVVDKENSKQGRCPVCGSQLMAYGAPQIHSTCVENLCVCLNCGVSGSEWASFQFDGYTIEPIENSSDAAKESVLMYGPGDRYGIYQIKDIENTKYAFRPFFQAADAIDRADYSLEYSDMLFSGTDLESLYAKHNRDDRPAGRTMHSLSMSDVVVTKRDGELATFYVDDFCFREVENFLKPEQGPIHEKVENIANELNDLFRAYDQHGYDDTVENPAIHAANLRRAIETGQDYDVIVKRALEEIVSEAKVSGETTRETNHAEELLQRLKVFESKQQP